MKKSVYTVIAAAIMALLAVQAGADLILAEVDFSGTANAAVPVNASPILSSNPQFTVFNAAISSTGVKAFAVGGSAGVGAWLYDSTGTAAGNADLYTISNYGSTTRLHTDLALAVAGETYTIKSVQIDVRAATSSGIVWQFGYQKAAGAVNTIVGSVAIAAQTGSDPITTYTIDLSNEGLTANSSTTAWTVSQGLRSFFYEATGTNNDGLQLDAIRLIGTSSIPEPATIGMLGLGALITLIIRRSRM